MRKSNSIRALSSLYILLVFVWATASTADQDMVDLTSESSARSTMNDSFFIHNFEAALRQGDFDLVQASLEELDFHEQVRLMLTLLKLRSKQQSPELGQIVNHTISSMDELSSAEEDDRYRQRLHESEIRGRLDQVPCDFALEEQAEDIPDVLDVQKDSARPGTALKGKAVLGVGDGCDYATLQAAVNAATSGDIIHVQGKTWTGTTATVNISSKSLTIIGGYDSTCSSLSSAQTVLDATGAADSVIEIYGSTAATVVLDDLEIRGGSDDANYGGGLEIDAGHTVTVRRCFIHDNDSTYGGGVHNDGGNLFLEENTYVYSNNATLDGGGIYCSSGGQVTLRGYSYIGLWLLTSYPNRADSDENNSGNGGGVYLDNASLFLDASDGDGAVIMENEAYSGGGVYATNGSLITLTGGEAQINQNDATLSGGGLYLSEGSDCIVHNGSVMNNTAGSTGGGFYATGAGTLVDFDRTSLYPCSEDHCTQLAQNQTSSSYGGGGYLTSGADLDFESVYIDWNQSGSLASGLYARGEGTSLALDSTMIIRNYSYSDYTIRLYNSAGGPTATLNNCTIAGNLGNSSAVLGIDDRTRFDGFGLIIWDNSGDIVNGAGDLTIDCSILQTAFSGSNNLVADPLFFDPDGGDYHISRNSPAVDHCNGTFYRDIDYQVRPGDVPGFLARSYQGDKEPAQAGRAKRDADRTVRFDPDENEAQALSRVVELSERAFDYHSWFWLELSEEHYLELQKQGIRFHEIMNSHIISFDRFRFDPVRDGEPPLRLAVSRATPLNEAGFGLNLVQLDRPLRDDEWYTLNAIVKPFQYYPGNCYLVWGQPSESQRLQGLDFVRWWGAFRSDYRLDDDLHQQLDGLESSEPVRLYARLLDDGSLDRLQVELSAHQGEFIGTMPVHQMNDEIALITWELVLPASEISWLLERPQLVHLSRWYPSRVLDERSNQIITDNAPGGEPVLGYNTWLNTTGYNGQGVTVAVIDTGADWDNPDLGNIISGTEYGGYEEPGEPGSDGGGPGTGHGTHVTGIVAGTAASGLVDPDGFLYGLGVAPGASLHVADALGDSPTPPNLYTRGYDAATHSDLSNNSYIIGPSTPGVGYNSYAADLDDYVHDAISGSPASPFLWIFAAGNQGNYCDEGQPCLSTINCPGEAKNIINVANSKSRRTSWAGALDGDIETIKSTSSRGPAIDGRIMPTVAAPGTYIISTRLTDAGLGIESCAAQPEGSEIHSYCTGTSMAAPHVTGVAALFTEFWRLRNGSSQNPLPATVKAAIIATTDDMTGEDGFGNPLPHRPNEHQGWGRINADRLLNPLVPIQFYENPHLITTSGSYWEIQVRPYSTSEALRISLVWTDAPGAPDANPALVNDLDLRVIDPQTTTWYGNVFGTDGWSQSGGTYDRLNNIENVWIENPDDGLYTVRISGFAIVGDGHYYNSDATDQHFSLVCYNCEEIVGGLYDAGADEAYAFVGVNGALCSHYSISAAVSAASSGDTIYLPSGLYRERIGPIDKDLTFVPAVSNCTEEDLAATSSSVVIDRDSIHAANGGIAEISGSSTVTFRHMTMTDASADYGGILSINSGASVILDQAVLSNGSASLLGGGARVNGTLNLLNGAAVLDNTVTGSGHGGGLALSATGKVELHQNSHIGTYGQPNTAAGHGGGVYIDGPGVLDLFDTSFIRNNEATLNGGGVYAQAGGDVIMHNGSCIGSPENMSGNDADIGGGLYLTGVGSTLTSSDSPLISYNTANFGGGLALADGATAQLSNTLIRLNAATNWGGGLYLEGGTTNLTKLSLVNGSLVTRNTANYGAGIYQYLNNTSSNVINSNIVINTASQSGGGIRIQTSSTPCDFNVSGSSAVSENQALAASGGGLAINGPAQVQFNATSLEDNSAATLGGGIALTGNPNLYCSAGTTVSGNSAGTSGGGISVGGTGPVTINYGIIESNEAIDAGGGIYLSGAATLIATDSEFRDNEAARGGAIANDAGTVTLRASNRPAPITLNQATNTGGGGGGIDERSGHVLTIEAKNGQTLSIDHNTSAGPGGGISLSSGSSLTLIGQVELTANSAVTHGGALYGSGGNAELEEWQIERPQILGNIAQTGHGGGIYAQDMPSLTLRGVDVGGISGSNQALTGDGGGLYLSNSSLLMESSIVRNNIANDDGGGLFMTNASQASVSSGLSPAARATSCDPDLLAADTYCSEFRSNQATGGSTPYGGAVFLEGGSLFAADTTAFLDNSASYGGAIYSSSAGNALTLENCRLSNNVGSNVIRILSDGTLTCRDTTFAGNPARAIGVNSSEATLTIDNTIIWDNTDGVYFPTGTTVTGSCNNTQDSSLSGISLDPLFVTTARGQYHLDPASPSVDACTTGTESDLDSVARPQNGDGIGSGTEFDMGAFETSPGTSDGPAPVPDGHFISGELLTALKLVADGSSLQVNWDIVTCPATEYLLLYGQMDTVDQYTNACIDSIDPDENGSFDWAGVASDNTWFIVVSSDGSGTEGSWGRNSSGTERQTNPVGPSACSTSKNTTGTCP
ncbi:S8 family serine peptidase [bacterium]|nr:S8 family serine peptidase [bacterium]